MPEVDYVVLSEWFDWIQNNTDVSVDLIGKIWMGTGRAHLWVGFFIVREKFLFSLAVNNYIIHYNSGCDA